MSHPLAGRSRRRRVLLVPAAQSEEPETGKANDLHAGPEHRSEWSQDLQTDVAEIPLDSGIDLQSLPSAGRPAAEVRQLPQTGPDIQHLKHLVRSPGGLTWIFAGDSISMGACHTQGHRSFAEFFSERLRWELGRQMDVVINTSVAGETARGLLHNLDHRVLRFPANVASLLIGLNDARAPGADLSEFHDTLEQIIQVLRDREIIPLLQTPNRVHRSEDVESLEPYVNTMRDLAAGYGLACIDHWAHWAIAAGHRPVLQSWLDGDGVHPNRRGHREMAKLIFAQLDILDSTSPSCRDD